MCDATKEARGLCSPARHVVRQVLCAVERRHGTYPEARRTKPWLVETERIWYMRQCTCSSCTSGTQRRSSGATEERLRDDLRGGAQPALARRGVHHRGRLSASRSFLSLSTILLLSVVILVLWAPLPRVRLKLSQNRCPHRAPISFPISSRPI
ncbi:hypothetical protein IWZ01DRAFT_103020 [Phyllosticta capitalensis]